MFARAERSAGVEFLAAFLPPCLPNSRAISVTAARISAVIFTLMRHARPGTGPARVCGRVPPVGVALDATDCAFDKDGLTVTLRRSKTDQQGTGRKIGIPYGSNPATCPVRTVQTWLELAAIDAGPLFRSISRHGHVQPGRLSPIDVARVVKKLAERAGLDAAKYAGHSLRAGHATSAAIAGASERSIMNQTGHRSVQMVRRYIRDGSLFRENSAGKLGL
jgi:integrase